MTKDISIVLVGIGGYGNTYVKDLGRGTKEGVRIVGAGDPYPAGCRYLEQIKQLGIPIYDTLDDF